MPKKSKGGYNEVSTMTGQQQDLYNRQIGGYKQGPESLYQDPLYQSGSNYLQGLLDDSPEAYQKFEAPFMRQFREQTIPMLSERFAGFGQGAQSSSAFQNALGQQGAALSEGLASLRGNLQLGATNSALGYAQQPQSNAMQLTGETTKAFLPKEQPWWQSALGGLAGGAGSGLGGGFGSKIAKWFL